MLIVTQLYYQAGDLIYKSSEFSKEFPVLYAIICLFFGGVSGFDAGDETYRCMPRAHFLS